MGVALAFIMGGARAEDDLSRSMLLLWIAVGLLLGAGLTLRRAVTTGALYGVSLGFASVAYGFRGSESFIEHPIQLLTGMLVGMLSGIAVTSIGAALTAPFRLRRSS